MKISNASVISNNYADDNMLPDTIEEAKKKGLSDSSIFMLESILFGIKNTPLQPIVEDAMSKAAEHPKQSGSFPVFDNTVNFEKAKTDYINNTEI